MQSEYYKLLRFKRAEKIAYINLTLLLLFCCKPYFRWFIPSGIYQITFLLTTSYSLYRIKEFVFEEDYYYYRRIVIALVFICMLVFNLPIFHEFRPGYFLENIIFIEIILFPTCIFIEAFKLLKQIFYWISIFAIIFWIIHLTPFDLPNYTLLNPQFRVNPLENYHIYGFCVSMYKGATFEGGFERVCGLFAEPGHFGIYLSLIMAANRFRFSTKQDVVMLIAGILTFSTAFYGIICIAFIYRLIQRYDTLRDLRKILLLTIIAMPFFFLSDMFQKMAIDRVVGKKETTSINSLIDNRVTKKTMKSYKQFINSNSIWLGNGRTDTEIVQETNWRGGVYRYGIVGIMVFLLLLISIISIAPFKYQMLMISISLLIMSHRIYIMVNGGLVMLIYMATLINSKNQMLLEFDEDSNIDIEGTNISD